MERQRLGLIAGNGRFPLLFALEAMRRGIEVVAVAHRGETAEELCSCTRDVTWIGVGELGGLIGCFKQKGINRVVMAGGISKVRHLSEFYPDARGIEFLTKMKNRNDDSLLRGIAEELASEGIEVVESTLFFEEAIVRPGLLTKRAPTQGEREDIALGLEVVRAIGYADVGQSVVVKKGIVLAVEASEGTDETILRGGRLGQGGVVVVKASKPGQDLRFDVPAIGLETAKSLREGGASTLALEAGKTIILDREGFIEDVNSAGIAVIGV
jgi:DUF1009 family protein